MSGYPLKNYAKGIAAIIAAVLAAIVPALSGDNRIDASEWVNVVLIGLGACAVLAAPNVPGARYTKTVLAVLTAVATTLASLISDGISLTDWLQVALAALAALGVYQLPYTPQLQHQMAGTGNGPNLDQ